MTGGAFDARLPGSCLARGNSLCHLGRTHHCSVAHFLTCAVGGARACLMDGDRRDHECKVRLTLYGRL